MLYLLNLIEYLAGRDDLAVVSLERYDFSMTPVYVLLYEIDELPLVQLSNDQLSDVLETFS